MAVSIHKYNTEHSAISSMEYRGCEIQYLTLGGCIFWRICLRICGSPHLVSDVGFPSENLWIWIDKNSRNRNFGHRRYSQISSLWKNSVWAPRTVSMNLDNFFSKKNYHDGAGMSSAFKSAFAKLDSRMMSIFDLRWIQLFSLSFEVMNTVPVVSWS